MVGLLPKNSRTDRSRTSCEYLLGLPIVPSSQEMESPVNSGRLTVPSSPIPEFNVLDDGVREPLRIVIDTSIPSAELFERWNRSEQAVDNPMRFVATMDPAG